MSNLQLSIEPGFYLEPQVASWVVGPEVEYIIFNQGGVPPAISEYVAYDQLVPPNPFIAVTQDGLGNVVYDGGFPKFYNTYAVAAGTPFASLPASFKFLYNALRWIANPEKVQDGNNKILVLGDNEVQYRINGTEPTDFKTTFDRIFASAGFVPTYKGKSAYGGTLDPRLAELNQYCAVLLMSSDFKTVAQITNQSAIDIATFRSQGNGLMFITDHGQVVSNINQAVNLSTASGFATANKVAVQFGAYFTGDYDRTPVNVGFLRSNYGDHPLYNGMANNESIAAGGSESKVVVASYTKHYPGSLPQVNINQVGSSVVQAAAKLTDGSIETYRGFFAIAEGEPLQIVDGQGNPLTTIDVGNSDKLPNLLLETSLAGAGTVQGEILRGTAKLGSFTYTDADGIDIVWYAGSADQNKVNNNSVITVKITSPFNYPVSLTVERFQPASVDDFSLAEFNAKLSGSDLHLFEAATSKLIGKLALLPNVVVSPRLSTAENMLTMKSYFGVPADGSKMPVLKIPMYVSAAAGSAAIGPGGTVPWTAGVVKNVVIITGTSELYEFALDSWTKVTGLNFVDIYGVGRIIENSLNGQRWRVAANGQLVAS